MRLAMQTGSGKTHTMLGEIEDLELKPSPHRGMTPRIFEFLFARIEAVILAPFFFFCFILLKNLCCGQYTFLIIISYCRKRKLEGMKN